MFSGSLQGPGSRDQGLRDPGKDPRPRDMGKNPGTWARTQDPGTQTRGPKLAYTVHVHMGVFDCLNGI